MIVGPCGGPLDPVEDAHQVRMDGAGAHLQGGDALQGEKHYSDLLDDGLLSLLFSFSAPEGTGGHPAPAGGGAPAQDTGEGLFCIESLQCQKRYAFIGCFKSWLEYFC